MATDARTVKPAAIPFYSLKSLSLIGVCFVILVGSKVRLTLDRIAERMQDPRTADSRLLIPDFMSSGRPEQRQVASGLREKNRR